MKRKNENRNKGFKSVFFKIASVTMVIYFIYTFANQQIQIDKYNSQIEMYRADIDNKNRLSEYYKSQKSSVSTDEYTETVAREELGYVKPYEKIFVDVNKN